MELYTQDTSSNQAISQTVQLVSGNSYVASYNVFYEDLSSVCQLAFTIGSVVVQSTHTYTTQYSWTTVSKSFTAPSSSLLVQIKVSCAGTGTADVLIDNVSVVDA